MKKYILLLMICSICFLGCPDDDDCIDCPPPVGGDSLIVTETLITNGIHPAISPDGKKLAFSINGDIYTCDTTGFSAKQLTSGGGYDELPQWHPNGTLIGFVRTNQVNTNTGVICTVDTNGTQVNSIIQDYFVADSLLLESAVTTPIWNWSPDGNKIAFINLIDSVTYLRLFSFPGSTEIKSILLFTNRPTNPTHNSSGFAFSPSGDQIIFVAQQQNQHTYLFKTSVNNDTTVGLLTNLNFTSFPSWTNVSDKVSANFFGEFTILTIDGTIISKTFGNVGKNSKWSPDGKYVLSEVTSSISGANGYDYSTLRLSDLNTDKYYRLTNEGDIDTHNYFYTWDPDSNIIYFQKFRKIWKIRFHFITQTL